MRLKEELSTELPIQNNTTSWQYPDALIYLFVCSENKETTDERVFKSPCDYGCCCDEEGANTTSTARTNTNKCIIIMTIIIIIIIINLGETEEPHTAHTEGTRNALTKMRTACFPYIAIPK